MQPASPSTTTANPEGPTSPSPVCQSCEESTRRVSYLTNRDDGMVLCLECGGPVFYCDLGGQG